ncbi:MAG: hypothetical protein ABI353_23800 [Isosphaeraceae bacterium]
MSKIPLALAILAALGWTTVGLAQNDDQDAALERLLEKVEGPETKADEPKPAPLGKTVDDQANAEPEQPGDASEPDDKALDRLLEKISEEDDAPPPPRPNKPSAGEPGPPKTDELQEATKLESKEKDLDRHLQEDIQGKRRKKPQAQQPQGSGKLGEAVDKMREVEKRLSKTDTGESTRKKQGEIVQDLESILKQLRQASSKGSGKGKMSRKTRQAGNQKGNQPGEPQQGANGGGVGPLKPKPPTNIAGIAGDKSAWGHLPPELRTELDNIFKEEPLESRRSLIERYYLSVNKKSRAGQE